MAPSEAQKKATAKYKEKNLKRIPLDVQKETYEKIKPASERAGNLSMATLKKLLMSEWNEIKQRTDTCQPFFQ